MKISEMTAHTRFAPFRGVKVENLEHLPKEELIAEIVETKGMNQKLMEANLELLNKLKEVE